MIANIRCSTDGEVLMGVVWVDNNAFCRIYGLLRRRTWKWAVLIFNIASAYTNPQKITIELGLSFVPVLGFRVTSSSVSPARSLGKNAT